MDDERHRLTCPDCAKSPSPCTDLPKPTPPVIRRLPPYATPPFTETTATVLQVTCEKCGQHWTVKAIPLMHKPGMWMHELEWQREKRSIN
jgi:hypothetical protein